MKITRVINGQNVEFELSPDEVYSAYLQKEHEFDLNDIKNHLMDEDPERFYEDYNVPLKWVFQNEELIENIANAKRNNMDKHDMHWDDALDDALKDVLDASVNEFHYDEIRRLEELKTEFARSRGWLGEDDEFISTWWENDEQLHAAEEYAYGILEKEHIAPLVDDCEKAPLESLITSAEQMKISAELTMIEMSYSEMCALFRSVEKTHSGHVTGYVVVSEDSFTKPYSETERTYVVSSNNKAYQPNMGGYSIHASSLDGSDRGVRLEAYLAAEKGGKDGWKIERCYMRGNEIHKAHSLINRSRDEYGNDRE